MAQNINSIKGTPRAKGEDVLVTEMAFWRTNYSKWSYYQK